jgi:uncharacterized protein (TIGR02996 family)
MLLKIGGSSIERKMGTMKGDINEEEVLLKAISEAPDSIEARFLYADWLQKVGDPRGDFIRIQCHLADAHTKAEQRILLQDREQDLLTKRRNDWERPLRGLGAE